MSIEYLFRDQQLIELIGKFVLPIVQQNSYKSKLTSSLENVRKLSDRIKEEATQCLAARVEKLYRNGKKTLTNTNDSMELLQKIYILLASNPFFNFRGTGKLFVDVL